MTAAATSEDRWATAVAAATGRLMVLLAGAAAVAGPVQAGGGSEINAAVVPAVAGVVDSATADPKAHRSALVAVATDLDGTIAGAALPTINRFLLR